MGVVLVSVGGFMMGYCIWDLFTKGPFIGPLFVGCFGFWLTLIGVLVS